MTDTTRPAPTEAAEYYFKYINQVPDGDICGLLDVQLTDALALFREVTDEQSMLRYAPGKWTIRQVVGHLSDTERLFTFRALWFGRGFESALPSFDPDVAVAGSAADDRSWNSHIEEFQVVRAATLAFFLNVPEEAWSRRGIASGNPFTVRALAWLAAGHVEHHLKILRESYLPQSGARRSPS